MTHDELKAQFTEAQNIIRDEKKMRRFVFRNQPEKCKAKMAEMDRLMEILVAFKDELKKHIAPEPEQGVLIDVPRKAEYR